MTYLKIKLLKYKYLNNKMTINHITRTVPKSNLEIVETWVKYIQLTHIYMTAYFPNLVQALQ